MNPNTVFKAMSVSQLTNDVARKPKASIHKPAKTYLITLSPNMHKLSPSILSSTPHTTDSTLVALSY